MLLGKRKESVLCDCRQHALRCEDWRRCEAKKVTSLISSKLFNLVLVLSWPFTKFTLFPSYIPPSFTMSRIAFSRLRAEEMGRFVRPLEWNMESHEPWRAAWEADTRSSSIWFQHGPHKDFQEPTELCQPPHCFGPTRLNMVNPKGSVTVYRNYL